MNWTNKYNLPEELVKACIVGERKLTQDEISCTQLIGSPRYRQLRVRYDADLYQDVSEMLWAVLGRGVHAAIEKMEGHNSLAETRLRLTVDGMNLSGQLDLYNDKDGGTIEDWKTCSVYAFLLGEKPEWVRQLNVYAYLARANGWPVSHLWINAIVRDWSATAQMRDPEYPPCPFQRIGVKVWTDEECRTYVLERLALHKAARHMDTMALPDCTPEERWEKPAKWAVMAKGRKRAVKLYDDEASATAALDAGQYVEHRPGASKKCELCQCRKVCNKAVEHLGAAAFAEE